MSIIEPATKQMLKNVIDGTTPPERAKADEDGKNFKDYYALKSELSSTVIETTETDLNNLSLDSGIYKNKSGFTNNNPAGTIIASVKQEVYYYNGTVNFVIIQTAAASGSLYQRVGYGTGNNILSRSAWKQISDSSGNTYATQADRLGSTTVGSPTEPIYLSSGTPTKIPYTLGDACAKGVSDSTSASALSSTDTNVPTVRDIYYGMPTINGTKASTASIYAPTNGGTNGYLLKGDGVTSAPIWDTVFKAITSYEKNFIYYESLLNKWMANGVGNSHVMRIPYSTDFDLQIEWMFTAASSTSSYHDVTITFADGGYASYPLVLVTHADTTTEQCSNMYGWIKIGSLTATKVDIRTYKNCQFMYLVMGLKSK